MCSLKSLVGVDCDVVWTEYGHGADALTPLLYLALLRPHHPLLGVPMKRPEHTHSLTHVFWSCHSHHNTTLNPPDSSHQPHTMPEPVDPGSLYSSPLPPHGRPLQHEILPASALQPSLLHSVSPHFRPALNRPPPLTFSRSCCSPPRMCEWSHQHVFPSIARTRILEETRGESVSLCW